MQHDTNFTRVASPLSVKPAPVSAARPWSHIGLSDVLPLLRRRWKGTVSVFAGTFAVCLAATVVLPERYTSVAQITIDQRSAQLVGNSDPMAGASMMTTEIETQAAVVTSQDVLFDVISALKLWQLPEYAIAPSLKDRLIAAIGLGSIDETDYTTVDRLVDLPVEIQSLLVEKLDKAVSSSRDGLTSIVDVHATSEDPRLAARIANVITQAYLDQQIEAGASTAQRAADFLEKRVNDLATQVEIKEKAVKDFLAANGATTIADDDLASQPFRLNKDLENAKRLYSDYAKRLEEVRQQTGSNLPQSRVVSQAIVPTSPSFPPRSLFILAGLIVAAGAGLGMTILRETLLGGFANDEQFEAVTGQEVHAMIPVADSKKPDMPYDEIVAANFSPFAEQIRRLRSDVSSRTHSEGQGGIVVLVTSSEPGEGKSTLSMSLTRQFALSGYNTAVVDADLRRPTLNSMVGRTANDGIVKFFSRRDQSLATIRKRHQIDENVGFDFIGGGNGHGVATDGLVGSSRFADLIKDMRSKYDVVILDTPPINHVVDAKIMARLADTTVYVVRQGGPSQRSVLAGLRSMTEAMAGGTVMPILYAVKGARAKRYGGYYNNLPRKA